MTKILHIDSSLKGEASNTRKLSAAIVAKLGGDVTYRDLVKSNLSPIDEAIFGAYYTPADDRSAEQKASLAQSDELLAEIYAADVIVIGAPMYNFSISASLKLYLDLICRVGETFQYTETGPKGLLEGKKIYFAIATGGTPIGSPADQLVPTLKTIFGFLGIEDQTVIDASNGMAVDPEATMAAAFAKIDALAA